MASRRACTASSKQGPPARDETHPVTFDPFIVFVEAASGGGWSPVAGLACQLVTIVWIPELPGRRKHDPLSMPLPTAIAYCATQCPAGNAGWQVHWPAASWVNACCMCCQARAQGAAVGPSRATRWLLGLLGRLTAAAVLTASVPHASASAEVPCPMRQLRSQALPHSLPGGCQLPICWRQQLQRHQQPVDSTGQRLRLQRNCRAPAAAAPPDRRPPAGPPASRSWGEPRAPCGAPEPRARLLAQRSSCCCCCCCSSSRPPICRALSTWSL
jgi:hypothetical protein